ncbi:MAG: hypothetical protein ABDH23_07080 [Endomicrobiia bacterium]
MMIKFLALLFFINNFLFSSNKIKEFGTDLYNIISDAKIGFGVSYEYVSTGIEFPHRNEINYSELNNIGLNIYHGYYYPLEKYIYYISARPTSRLSLKLTYEDIISKGIYDYNNSLLKNTHQRNSQLDIEYFISPRWSLYGVIFNKKENNSLGSLLFPTSTLIGEENKEYKLSNVNSDSVTIGTKVTLDWGNFNLYTTMVDVYNYLPALRGIPPDFITLSYTNNSDNFLKKENEIGINYFLNPAVKLDILGSYGDKISYTNQPDDTFVIEKERNYPFEIKYRLTEIWELGVKVGNKHYSYSSEVKNKTFSNNIEMWEIEKNNFYLNNSSILLSLNRYFKYQGLNISGRFSRFTEDKLYEYEESILYGQEKSTLWTRWDSSVEGYSLELSFFYRPIMQKLYVSAGIVYNFPVTRRHSTFAEVTESFYDYTFSAFYKPTALFEIKVEKGYRNISTDYRVPSEIYVDFREPDVWLIEKNSSYQLEEKEKVGVTLRTLRFTLGLSIQQSSVGKTYYKREHILSSDRYTQPWAFFDIYQRFIIYELAYSYTTQALFSQSQLTLSGGIYYKPDYTYDDGRGGLTTVSEQSYLFSVRYEFTPTFYIEGQVEEGHYFETSRNLGLENTGSILAKEGFHSFRQAYKISLVYRP